MFAQGVSNPYSFVSAINCPPQIITPVAAASATRTSSPTSCINFIISLFASSLADIRDAPEMELLA